MARSQGIRLKKRYGQHFLRQQSVIDNMLDRVALTPETSVFEIGCGDGFLTRSILGTSIARLWIFEIDPEWATYVQEQFPDERLTMRQENFLDADFTSMEEHKPWTLLANLPYQVTFPILHRLQEYRHLLAEGVVMVQEEVAQKIVKTSGRGYGFPSLFFQHYFDWELMEKIPPSAFHPPPKVDSRLLYFKPKKDVQEIPDEPGFWKFIKVCFRQPRRTLRNNLMQTAHDLGKVPDAMLAMRAQQLGMNDFLSLWNMLRQ